LFRQQAYVNGAWISETDEIPVFNPATGERLGSVPRLPREALTAAIAASHAALPAWRDLPAKA
jgi:succinate-semialdehyde dehydrogenase/glutarate-semialdehyde dehydrogenase